MMQQQYNPFGLTEDVPNPLLKQKDRTLAKPRTLTPKLSIRKENRKIPREVKAAKPQNLITIPEQLLSSINRATTTKSDDLSKLILTSSASSVLAYDAAANLVQTVLADGFGIDADVDTTLPDALQQITRLEVVFFFIKRLKLPRSVKQQFMKQLVTKTADSVAERITKVDKSKAYSELLSAMSKRLEGHIVSQHKRKQEETTDAEAPKAKSRYATSRRRPR